MKINVDPADFADLCILFLLDTMTNKEMMVKDSNKKLALVSDKLAKSGFRSIFMTYFFSIDPSLRQKYKNIRHIFAEKSSNQHTILITQDKKYLDRAKRRGKKAEIDNPVQALKKAVKLAAELLVASHNVNPKKLEMLQEQVIKLLEKDGDI